MCFDRLVASRGRRSGARAVSRKAAMTAVAALSTSILPAAIAEAKGPGRSYCFHKTCHRVKTIAETQALVGKDIKLIASHYDNCRRDRFNPCGLTSSGERFASESPDNAASPILPDGTIALVWSKYTRQAIVLRINNAGPYWGNRKLDLSRAAARKLGIGGVGEVMLRVLRAPTAAEARYAKNRVYERVPGPIGEFASLDAAHAATSVMVAQGQPRTTALAGLAAPVTSDPAVSLAAAFQAPLAPGFALPKGALAEALAAQSAAERRVVTAAAPPAETVTPASVQASIDVVPVTPKLVGLAPVKPSRRSVKAIEVATSAAASSVSPPAAVEAAAARPAQAQQVERTVAAPREIAAKPRVRRSAAVKPARKERPAHVAAVKPVAAPKQTSAASAATRPSRADEGSGEIHVGFTTYAEARYQPKKKAASSVKPAPKAVVRAPQPPAVAAVPPPPSPTKRAGLPKSGRSAALKAGGWQSSAVFEVPEPRPALTGSHPAVPAGGLRDETEMPRRPGFRVNSSALV